MQRLLKDVLRRKGNHVVCIAPSATVIEAVQLMNQKRIGSVVVTKGDKAIGMFTERDVLIRVVADGRDPNQTIVADVMSAELVTVDPGNTVEATMAIITERRCRHLPVVADGKLIGLISIGDLTKWILMSQERKLEDMEGYISGSYPV